MHPYTREEIMAEKARRDAFRQAQTPPGIPASATSPYTREELEVEKSRRDALRSAPEEQEEDTGFHWPKFIVQQAGVGALSLPDLLMAAAKVAAKNNIPFVDSEVPGGAFGQSDIQKRISESEPASPEKLAALGLPSDIVPQTEVPETGAQRIAGHAARGIGAGISGGPANALRNMLLSGAQGAVSGAAQEAGVNPLLADVASGLGVGRAASAVKSATRKGLSDSEKSVGRYLHKELGEQDRLRTLEALENAPKYQKIQYEPMTAEVAGTHNPLFPQLHRLRYETVGSGLPAKSATQRQAIADSFEQRTLNAATSDEIKSGLKDELKARIKQRREATQPLYEQVDEATQRINPSNTKAYLKKNIEAGALESDKEFVKKAISNPEKMSPGELRTEREYAKLYNGASPEVRARMEPPKIYPEARRLAAASRAIRSKIEKVKRAGEKQRGVKLSEALEGLEQDLDILPIHKEATQKYKEYSGPVNEIDKHKGMSKILKTTSNDVVGMIFDKNSKYNVEGLQKALSKNPALMEGVKEASIRHIEHSIGNSGAQGAHNVLSYPKLRKFLNKHNEALGEIFNQDQADFINELSHGLHGQNIAKTLGKGEGSPTYSRLVSDLGVGRGLGLRAAESASHLLPSKLGGKPLRFLLSRYSKMREADVMSVLDRALQEPAFAKDLLKRDFGSQREFNTYVNGVLKGSIVPASESSRRKQDDEDED